MRKLFFLLTGVLITIVLTSFTSLSKRETKISYAYVTALEYVKTNGSSDKFYDVYTKIVEVKCNHGYNEVARQFLSHYYAQEETSERHLVNGNNTSAWLYDTYDEAYEKRRESMAKTTNSKRIIDDFYVTCD